MRGATIGGSPEKTFSHTTSLATAPQLAPSCAVSTRPFTQRRAHVSPPFCAGRGSREAGRLQHSVFAEAAGRGADNPACYKKLQVRPRFRGSFRASRRANARKIQPPKPQPLPAPQIARLKPPLSLLPPVASCPQRHPVSVWSRTAAPGQTVSVRVGGTALVPSVGDLSGPILLVAGGIGARDATRRRNKENPRELVLLLCPAPPPRLGTPSSPDSIFAAVSPAGITPLFSIMRHAADLWIERQRQLGASASSGAAGGAAPSFRALLLWTAKTPADFALLGQVRGAQREAPGRIAVELRVTSPALNPDGGAGCGLRLSGTGGGDGAAHAGHGHGGSQRAHGIARGPSETQAQAQAQAPALAPWEVSWGRVGRAELSDALRRLCAPDKDFEMGALSPEQAAERLASGAAAAGGPGTGAAPAGAAAAAQGRPGPVAESLRTYPLGAGPNAASAAAAAAAPGKQGAVGGVGVGGTAAAAPAWYAAGANGEAKRQSGGGAPLPRGFETVTAFICGPPKMTDAVVRSRRFSIPPSPSRAPDLLPPALDDS